AILVCVDRLTKMAHFCPTTTNVNAEETARLYLKHVFKHHGLPDDIVTDRGTQLTSRFTTSLLQFCNIRSNKSTAFHPQSDGQTERVNQILEQYLRIFCDYHQEAPLFQPGDMVWLSRRYINTTRPSSKLDFKRIGPFKVIAAVGDSKLAYKLELPQQMRIHPVFHVSLLDPYRPNTITGRAQLPAHPIVLEDSLEWEVAAVLDSRIRYGKLEYFVDWVGYQPCERTWEPASHLANSPDMVATYHRTYPLRPAPHDLAGGTRNWVVGKSNGRPLLNRNRSSAADHHQIPPSEPSEPPAPPRRALPRRRVAQNNTLNIYGIQK